MKFVDEGLLRIGFGYDVHKFSPDRKLVLGGVEIPSSEGLEGHSDADVLLHAIMDAILGALALGDIGRHFPDTDPGFEGVSSLDLLHQVAGMIKDRGYSVGNVDSTLVLEVPKISPFTEAMRENIANTLEITSEAVSIKATTQEKLGFVGDRKGVVAHAVVLLIQQ